MTYNKTICLSITLMLLSYLNLHGMENLKDIMPYNPTNSSALCAGVRTSIQTSRVEKTTLNRDQKMQIADLKLKNKEIMLNVTTAVTATVIAAPVIFYALGEATPIIGSGLRTIAQASTDFYDFFKESWPNWN